MTRISLLKNKILLTIGAALVGVCALGDEVDPEAAAEPLTARWTGGAGNADPADAGNWDCFDAVGVKIPDALPTDSTAVTLSGSLAIDVPVGTAFPYATLSFGECKIAADCDWRGLDLTRIGASGVVDLNGRTVAVGAFVTARKLWLGLKNGFPLIRIRVESRGNHWGFTGESRGVVAG